jgi:hypothetical protein
VAADFKTEHLETAPPWLRDPVSDTTHRVQGDAKDKLVARLRAGVRARYPLIAPEDALERIGNERGIERGPDEDRETYAARLASAWDAWEFAGTPLGVLRALHYASFPSASILTQRGRYFALDGSLNLTWTDTYVRTFPAPNFWNSFVVFFTAPLPSQWSGGVPADGSPTALLVKRLVKKWKAAHALFVGVVIVTSGHVWGQPGLKWGTPGVKWGGTHVTWAP